MTVEATFDVTPEQLWSVLSDPTTYPDWLVGADHMRGVDPAFPEPGSAFEHSVGPGGPLTVDDRSESLVAEPEHRLDLLVHAGPFHAVVDFHLRHDEDGTVVAFTEKPVGIFAPLLPLLRPLLAARNRQSLQRLRQFLRSSLR